MLFQIETVDNKDISNKAYFKIIDIIDDNIYGVYVNSFSFDKTNLVFDKDPFEVWSPILRFFEINKSDFVNGSLNGKFFRMKDVSEPEEIKINNIKIQIKNMFVLVESKTGDPYLEISKVKGNKNYGVPSDLIKKFKSRRK